MVDYIEIGSSPAEESCAQVGQEGYFERAQIECKVFINQLKRTFGDPPQGAQYVIKHNPHDFGTYYEVAIKYTDVIRSAVNYALRVEGDTPGDWDDTARAELERAIPGYFEMVRDQ